MIKLIIGGATKCGTTWFHENLDKLDGFDFMKGEVHDFDINDRDTHYDINKYNYRLKGELHENDKLCIDHPTLIHSKLLETAKISQWTDANTKVLLIIRDPYDRAISHFFHTLRTGRRLPYIKNIQDIFDTSYFIKRSRYKSGIELLTGIWPNQIKIVDFDKFFRDDLTEFEAVCDFLGLSKVESEVLKPFRTKKSNRSKYPRLPRLWQFWSNTIPSVRGRLVTTDSKLFNILIRLRLAMIVILSLGYTYSKPTWARNFEAEARRYLAINTSLKEEYHECWETISKRNDACK